MDNVELPLESACAAIQIGAHHIYRMGWRVVITQRRAHQGDWHDAEHHTYNYLTSEELFDVVVLEVARCLGIDIPLNP